MKNERETEFYWMDYYLEELRSVLQVLVEDYEWYEVWNRYAEHE